MIITILTLLLSIVACIFSVINFIMNKITRKKINHEPTLIEKLTFEHQVKHIGRLRKKIMRQMRKKESTNTKKRKKEDSNTSITTQK